MILVVALGVFASLQGGDDGGSLNAVAEAAEKTQDQPGGRAVMHSVVTTPEKSDSFTVTGQMVFDAEGAPRRL